MEKPKGIDISGKGTIHKEKEGIKEIPRIRRSAGRSSLREVLKDKKGEDGRVEDKTIYAAYAYVRDGYTLMEMDIADVGVHYATTSRAKKRAWQHHE